MLGARMLVLHMWLLAATAAGRGLRSQLARPARLTRVLCSVTADHAQPSRGSTKAARGLSIALAKERRGHVLKLCQELNAAEAVAAVQQLEADGDSVPTFIYNSLIIACINEPSMIRPVAERMWTGMLRPDDGTYSALVRNYVHWGDLRRAVRVLYRMIVKDMTIRRRSVQPLINALCERGLARAAVRVWERTENLGVVYAAEDFATLLAACCRAGELGYVQPLLRRLRDEAEDRLPHGVLAVIEAGLRAARLPDGSAAFAVERVQIDSPALHCSHCGTELEQLRLTDEQRRVVRERLAERARSVDRSGALPQTLENFERWLASAPPYDCVIDGPNVAYDDQNFVGGRFNYYQVEDMRQHVQALGLRPMVVMPSKYMPSNFPMARIPNHTRRQRHATTELSIEELLIIEHWRQLGVVYEAELSGKDDWLWMYASLLGDGRLVVTNDEMRDHWLHLLEHRLFRRWKESQLIHFEFTRQGSPGMWAIKLQAPLPWAHATQRADNGVWHIASDEGSEWLCARPLGEHPVEAEPRRGRAGEPTRRPIGERHPRLQESWEQPPPQVVAELASPRAEASAMDAGAIAGHTVSSFGSASGGVDACADAADAASFSQG